MQELSNLVRSEPLSGVVEDIIIHIFPEISKSKMVEEFPLEKMIGMGSKISNVN